MAELKLGCGYPSDKRAKQIPLMSILTGEITFPDEFDAEVDVAGREFDGYMWGNDQEGNCVIVGQGNYERVLEFIEQGFEITITTKDIHDEYRRQTGGEDKAHDTGLFMGSAMSEWEKTGWDVTGTRVAAKNKAKVPGCWRRKTTPVTPVIKRQHLDIHASAEVYTPDDLRACVYALHGCLIAVRLYQKDFDQFYAGEPWDLTGNDGAERGGHCVYVPKYYKGGDRLFDARTWKKRQKFTERWYEARQYDARGVADNRDKFLKVSPVDPEKLEAKLLEIARA
jgi:hypothetical protein